MLLEPLLFELLYSLSPDVAYSVTRAIPTMVIAVALIAAGIWLLGLHPKRSDGSDVPPFPGSDGPQ